MEQLYIADVADVTFTDKETGNVFFTGEAQVTGITGEEEEEKIFGGIGNKHIYTIRHSKELTLNVTNATFALEYFAMTQGASIEDGSETVAEYERDLKVEGGEVTLSNDDYNGDVVLKNADGNFEKVVAVSGVVEVPSDLADDGDSVDAAYTKEISGRVITIDATQFSRNYEVTYRTIVYSVDTNEIVSDLYFIFPNASPSGAYEISLENGEAYTPEIEFAVMAEKNSDELGKIVQVPRKKEEDGTP